ncbi:MAG TPA: IS110 family transposase [Candidatus Methylomirabilis sp.]|nr:IS110 family transposase [Candidatus Methylomirabilis sp.]
MRTMPENVQRVKRFRELKATLRTDRSRLLVGLDIAQAEHVAQFRHAHTRVVVPTLTIPNTTRGFAQLWARIQQAQRATGCREVVCGLEPTGTYHQAVATFLEAQGADVVLLSSSVAYWHRRMQDGTWDKNDRKDAANCAELLEEGKVLFYSRPDGPLAELRRLVRCLRRARTELAACKARWRTTLRPTLGPMGEPLPNRLRAELPAVLQAWERAAPGRPAVAKGRLPLGLTTACVDLGAQVEAVQARIAALEQACTPVAERLPAYALLRTIPGVGPTVGAILLAEIGDVTWFTKFSQLRKLAGLDIVRVQSGQFAGQWRISKCGRGLLRWALYQAAMGVSRTATGRARLAALKAKRQGDRYAGFKAIVELAAKLLRVVWGVWRSGTPYDPQRAGGLQRQPR